VKNLISNNPSTLPNTNFLNLASGLNWIADRVLLIKPGEVLNPGSPIHSDQNPAQALRKAAKEMTAEALDATGEHVNYQKLANCSSYSKFRQYTLSLPSCKPEDIGDRNDQIAFWVNLYNALIIDAVIHYQIDGSLLSKPSLFRRAAYNVAGFRFSADDIEHGILRGNRHNPSFPVVPFDSSDPRRMMMIEPLDPRIHFALVCGAVSCPPISFYEGSRIDEQLDQAAGSFINGGGVSFDPLDKSLMLSRILKWYRSDFGGSEGVLDVILKYSKDEIVKDAIQAGSPKIRYLKYDWSVNSLA
jgi:hypothetical protein